MARKTYYLFRYSVDQFRWGDGYSVGEASLNAFGVDYTTGGHSGILYKVIGTRAPAYLTVKAKQELHSEKGWLTMQDKPKPQCLNCGKAMCDCKPSEKAMAASRIDRPDAVKPKMPRVIFSEMEALRYLAQCVEEAIIEGYPVNTFTGDGEPLGGVTKPDKFHAKRLALMLDTLNMHEAANTVRRAAGIEEVERG